MVLQPFWRCLLLVLLAMWTSQTTARILPPDALSTEKHESWMAKYGRTYNDEMEKAKRFKIFMDNVEYIESFNKNPTRTYELAVNEFTDLTKEEFKKLKNGFRMQKLSRVSTSFRYENVTNAPSTMDWEKKGAVMPVKDQGLHCESCWAFSAVASTEGINQIKIGKLVSLSEQKLIDCDDKSSGCSGGYMDTAFEFIKKNGLTSEAKYPYKGTNGTCDTKKESAYVVKISGYEGVPVNSESDLLKAVANQPISVAIDSNSNDFTFYSKGIFNGTCETDLDHAVLLVGYGETKHGLKYWLVKNSWGTSWGEKGFIRMARGIKAAEGICGIAMMASYPLM